MKINANAFHTPKKNKTVKCKQNLGYDTFINLKNIKH